MSRMSSRKTSGKCSLSPFSEMVPKQKNKDMFANAKAQAWWSLRMRFEQTHRAVAQKLPVDVDAIISVDPILDELAQLRIELSQITYSINASGKIVIDKQPPCLTVKTIGPFSRLS